MTSNGTTNVRQIAFFGGQGCRATFSKEISTEASRYVKSSSIASLLLSTCHAALLEEVIASANEQSSIKDEIRNFTTPESLLSPAEQFESNPIVQGVTLCIHQLLSHLKYIEPGPGQPSLDVASSDPLVGYWAEVIGYCSGVLPAAVITSSRTVKEYIETSKEIIRLAFWIGFRVSNFCEKLAGVQWRDTPWTAAVSGVTENIVGKFNSLAAENSCQKLCISAKISPRSITVSGPGHSLQSFRDNHADHMTSWQLIPVYGLYHGGDSSISVVDEILRDAKIRKISFPEFHSLHTPIRSSAHGKHISPAVSNLSLIETALRNMMTDCADWQETWCNATATSSPEGACETARVEVHAFGPHSPSMLNSGNVGSNNTVEVVDHSKLRSDNTNFCPSDGIAIVGMSVEFPGGDNKDALWEVLENGLNMVQEIPGNRFKVSDYHADGGEATRNRRLGTRFGNFLEKPWAFDNSFFGISPREAKSMDPQQKLLLQNALHALDDAGYVPDSTRSFQRSSFGCYVGVATGDYVDNLREDIDVHYSTGTLRAFLSGKLSYAFKWSGPCMTIDTACSASAVSVSQACSALQNGDCSAAIAGGVNAITSPDMYMGLSRAHFLNSTGQCKAFDASADGYSRSEGCGLFILKRLEDAVAENDRIYGVIRGIAINQCGKAHSITHPHAGTQASLFRTVLSKAGVEPSSVSVVEAHGTGTQAGDAAEMSSIQEVFGKDSALGSPIHITSIKANIGHAEAASGSAALAKIFLMLKKGTIPPQSSLVNLNPRLVPLKSENMKIATEAIPWKSRRNKPRLALLNNFGAAGSNVAMIIEEFATNKNASSTPRSAYPFSISARTAKALQKLCSQYLDMNMDGVASSVQDICYTATARRQRYGHRVSLICTSLDDLSQQIRESVPLPPTSAVKPLILVFSGQGGSYVGMGQELLNTSSVFRDSVNHCERLIKKMGFPSVMAMIDGTYDFQEGQNSTYVSQTACFVVQHALAKMWLSWNITPHLVLGHSLGEYAALVTAGVLSLEDGLRFVGTRARLMAEYCSPKTTGMLSCNLGKDGVESLIASDARSLADLTVACQNSTTDSVVSGPLAQLDTLRDLCAASGYKSKMLDVPYGFHSAAMDPILPALKELSSNIRLHPPKYPVGSTVYGRLATFEDMNEDYFTRQTRQAVLFTDLMQSIMSKDELQLAAFLEIGPTPLTIPLVRRSVSGEGHEFLSSLKRQEDAWKTLSTSLLKLDYCHTTINWREVFSDVGAKVVDLPEYPLEKAEHFVAYKDPSRVLPARSTSQQDSDFGILLSRKASKVGDKVNAFESDLEILAHYITGHVVGGVALCPASVYCEMAMEGLRAFTKSNEAYTPVVSDLAFNHPLVYAPNSGRVVHLEFPNNTEAISIGKTNTFAVSSIASRGSSIRTAHSSGAIIYEATAALKKSFARKAAVIARQISYIKSGGATVNKFHTKMLYETIFPRVVLYAPSYRSIEQLSVVDSGLEGFGIFRLPEQTIKSKDAMSPAFTDSIIHAAGFIANSHVNTSEAYICVKVESIKVLEGIDQSQTYTIYCSLMDDVESNLIADAYAISSSGAIVASAEGMNFKKVQLRSFQMHLSRLKTQTSSKSALVSATAPANELDSSSGDDTSNVSEFFDSGIRSSATSPGVESAAHAESIFKTVAQTILRVSGISAESLSAQSRLSDDIGIDSILSIELLDELKRKFPAAELDKNSFVKFPTLVDLQNHIASSSQPLQNNQPSKAALAEVNARLVSKENRKKGKEVNKSRGSQRSATAGKIRKILQEVCGATDDELKPRTTLAAIGLDSLLSIELRTAIERDLGHSIEAGDLTEDLTVGELEKLLTGGQVSDGQAVGRDISPAGIYTPESIESSPPLMKVNPIPLQIGEENTTPLYLFHDGSGSSKMYARLPEIGINLFAVANPGLGEVNHWAGNLEEMAEQYVAAIELRAGNGVIVGGWSFGGVLAYEIAQQLTRLGKRVQGVILIDSPFPQDHIGLPEQVIQQILKPLNPKTRAVLSTQFRSHAKFLSDYRATRDISKAQFVTLHCRDTYNTTKLCGVQYPWLEDQAARFESLAKWKKLCGKSHVLSIPGNHFEPFSPSNIQEVAKQLREAYRYITRVY